MGEKINKRLCSQENVDQYKTPVTRLHSIVHGNKLKYQGSQILFTVKWEGAQFRNVYHGKSTRNLDRKIPAVSSLYNCRTTVTRSKILRLSSRLSHK